MDNNRSTISVICPQCGAQQEAEPTQDAVICRYCGRPFAVQSAVNACGGAYTSPGPAYSTKPPKPRKRHTFWWVVGWIFCFPIPLTILVARSRKLGGLVKAVIITAAWIVYLLLGASYRPGANGRAPETSRTPAVVETTPPPRPTARPTMTPKPTATPAPSEEETVEEAPAEESAEEPVEEAPAFPDSVTPEFKAAMDSYEAFFDEYCDFMKKMSDDPSDFTVLMEYADVMTRYADIMDKLDAIDEDELSPADEAYYIESMARIEIKLLEAANYVNE